MVRVDLEGNIRKKPFTEFEPEVIRPRKIRKKPSFKKSCFLILVVILLFFLITSVAVLARTGIAEIPFFSAIFYQTPKPTRVIEIEDSGEMAQKSPNITLNLEKGLVNFELTEQDLTFILRQSLTGQKDSYFAQNLQLVITNQQIELFGLLLRPVSANLTLNIKPFLTAGKLSYAVVGAKIGDLSVPAGLANWVLDKFIKDKDKQIGLNENDFQFTALELKEGKLDLEVKIEVDKTKDIITNTFNKLLDLKPTNLAN